MTLREIKDDIRFLQDEGATYFVNACNSMSVVTTDQLLSECGISPHNYTDMIRAFSHYADFKKGERVLVVATVATLRSRVYQDFLEIKGVTVVEHGFVALARAIEDNEKHEVIMSMIEPALVYAQENNVTKIIYGCTHYPLIHEVFKEVARKILWEGEFIDPAFYVAKEVVSWNLSGEKKFTPYSSKDTPAFIKNVVSTFSM
jgi:glutamate racemase